MEFRFSLRLLCEKFFIRRRTEQDMIKNVYCILDIVYCVLYIGYCILYIVYWSSCKVPLSLLSDFNTLRTGSFKLFNPLNAELNPIRHLLALLGAHHILEVGRIRVKRPFPGFLTILTL